MCHIPVLCFVLLFSVVFYPDRPGAIVGLYYTWIILYIVVLCEVFGDLVRLLGILLRTFGFLALKLLKIIRLAKLLALRVPETRCAQLI